MGSKSDLPKMEPCAQVLKDLGVDFEMTVSSAHRTPERTQELVREAEENGCQVIICAAGMAAHLAGAVAARTVLPVLGVPIDASPLGGWDSLLSTVQMPPGFPVGTLALDKAGAKNAAWMAAQILALQDPELKEKIQNSRREMAAAVEEAARDMSG
jgi:5-(carboxyamino)imidazole ribonucleotide mutase